VLAHFCNSQATPSAAAGMVVLPLSGAATDSASATAAAAALSGGAAASVGNDQDGICLHGLQIGDVLHDDRSHNEVVPCKASRG
jgi:hypothetical protein